MGNRPRNSRAHWRRIRGQALGTVSIIPFLVMGVGRAFAQPVGASVVAGQVQVSSSGATTTINQATSKAIINWQDFSVGQGASVQFNQPNAASITLNRVTGSNISNIDGAVRANGQVWLLNPNGVLFGANARINVGGLLATTSDLANQDFNEGRYNFTRGRNAVVNNGKIQASNGGSVVLSAPKVVNNGIIQANAGHVVLGGTDTFTVDFNGDHLLSYAIASNSTGGAVSNTGKISTPGGRILLTARAASDVQGAVINNSGTAEATSVREENGEIVLEAEDGGVASSGNLDASGKGTGETGGTVKVLGKEVAIADGAIIDVSGDASGGTALVGGNFHGQGSEQHAQATTIAKASIKADAISRGNGGKVAVWSDGRTDVSASITARGGAVSGNGGQVETSGHELNITPSAFVSTLAPKGKSGNWLLDPDDIIIVNGGCTALDINCPNLTYGSSGTASVDPTAISNALVGTDVTLQANNSITVTDAVLASGSHTLELDAGGSIFLNNDLRYLGGSIVLRAQTNCPSCVTTTGGSITGLGSVVATKAAFDLGANGGSIGGSGGLRVNNGGAAVQLSANTAGADAYFLGGPSVLITTVLNGAGGQVLANPGVTLGTGNFKLTGTGGISQDQRINANDLSANTDTGNITLTNSGNTINGTARFTTTTSGDVDFLNSLPVVLGSSEVIGTLSVTSNNLSIQVADSTGIRAVHATIAVNLTAPTLITQDLGGAEIPIQTADLNLHTTGTGPSTISMLDSTFGGPANYVTNSVVFNNRSNNTAISFFNAATTNVTGMNQASSVKIVASDIINGNSVGINLDTGVEFIAGTVTLDATGDIALLSTTDIAAPTVSLTSHGGSIGTSGSAIAISNDGGGVSLAVSNIGASGDAYVSSTDPVTVTSAALSGGVFDLRATGDITLTGAIGTSNNYIFLLSDGSLNLNANITDTGGTLFLLANSAFSAPAASITGTGTLSAADVAILLYGDSASTGSIGTSINPLKVTSGNATLELQASTGSQSAYITSLKPVDISGIDSILSITTDYFGDGGGTFGDFNLTAAGQVSQSAAITARNLTVLSPNAGIDLSNPENSIRSTVTLGAMETGRGAAGTIVFQNSEDTQLGHIGGIDPSGSFQPGLTPLAAQSIQITATQFAGGTQPSVTINDYVVSGNLTSIAADQGIIYNYAPMTFPVVGDSVLLNSGITAVGAGGGASVEVRANSLSVTAGPTSNIYLAVTPLSGSAVDISGSLGGIGLDAGPPGPNQGNIVLDYYDGSLTESGAISAAYVTATGHCTNSCGPLDVSLTGANRITGTVTASTFGTGNFSLVNTMDLTLGSFSVGGTINVQTNDTNQTSSPTYNPADPHAYIAIQGAIGAGTGNSVLHASGEIHNADFAGDQIFADGLSLISDHDGIGSATGLVDLSVNNLRVKTSGGDVWLTTFGSFNLYDAGAGVSGFDTGLGNVNITADGLTQSTSIASGDFTLNLPANPNSGAPVILTDVNNAISGNITINAMGGAPADSTPTVAIVNSQTMNIAGINIVPNPGFGSVGNVSLQTLAGDIEFKGAVNGGNILAVSAGNLIIDSGVVITATGNRSTTAILLSANGNFINNSGPSVFNLPGSGNWQIYSASPANDVFGNLNSQNYAIYNTTYPAPVSAAGNRYVFAYQPSLTISANAAGKTYGVDNSAALVGAYTISAVNAIQAPNAFLTDTSASFSGTPSVTSTGSAAAAGVGTYAITVGAGTFAANGYAVIFQDNVLSVTPATLAYVANPAGRTYGAANPAFSGNVTGFVNGDSVASATSGALVFTSSATAANGVGSYAINGSGLLAPNYVFIQAPGNATALTISPAALLYVANAASRAVGDPNPAFTGNVTGFVNGDLPSVTRGALVFGTNAALTSAAGQYAINGSGLSAANYIFAQALGNATALTVIAPPPPETGGLDDIKTIITSFANTIDLPLNNLVSRNQQGDGDAPPPVPPPPPPPPPAAAGDTPLADLTGPDANAEPPSSSDQATADLVASLEGSPGKGAAPIIPGLLDDTVPPPPPSPVDVSELPGFGNSALWQ